MFSYCSLPSGWLVGKLHVVNGCTDLGIALFVPAFIVFLRHVAQLYAHVVGLRVTCVRCVMFLPTVEWPVTVLTVCLLLLLNANADQGHICTDIWYFKVLAIF